jgi:phosphoenolpyruvate-protein phosphotransferase (PTS system enzyme I)
MQQRLVGMPASPGVAIGPVHLLRWEVPEVRHRIVADEEIPAEKRRFRDALERAKSRVRQVRDRAEKHAGPEEAQIFDAQLLLLDDPELLAAVDRLIEQNLGAEKAFDVVLLEWRQHFARHSHAMMRERVGDLTDVHIRVLTLLLGLSDHDPVDLPAGASAILVTHDLTPTLTVQLDRAAIAGIATDAGTRTSHVAILARSLGMPAVVGLRDATVRLRGAERVILDGSAGTLVVDPTEEEIDRSRRRAEREAQAERELERLASVEPVTRDGVRVVLRANVDLPEEAERAATSGAEGVGLLRTEFLVVGRTTMPDEDEQFRAYRRVLDAFAGQPVVIRTFDIGGDKLPVGGFPSEPNPFLGWRAIRMCLDQPEIFLVQLRAILRAAALGDVRIMLPLVVSVAEVRETRALLERAAADLRERGVGHRADVPLGVMVETPAAAVAADSLARDVAFFSIGTNDLVQYTLAVDRGNANLAARFTPLHPAVLQLIRRTVEVAAAHGLEVTCCGEMASQPLTAFALVGLGVRQLSVGTRAVPVVKQLLRAIALSDAETAVRAALACGTADEVERELRAHLRAMGVDQALLHDPDDGLPVHD